MNADVQITLDELFSLLSVFIFQSKEAAAGVWKSFSRERQDRFCVLSADYEIQAFFYYFLFQELTPEQKKQLLPAVRAIGAKTTKQIVIQTELRKLFRENSIRFLPMKGAVLAFDVYPEPLLRHMVDLDILIHPDDMEKTRKLLSGAGWNGGEYLSHHHYAPYARNSMRLEIHRELPGFPCSDSKIFWDRELQKKQDGEYFLSPELMLLLLCSHAKHHHYHNAFRMLLDLAFLIRKYPIDWNKIIRYADQFNLPLPNPLFSYASELFQHAEKTTLPPDLPEMTEQEKHNFKQMLTQTVVYSEISWDRQMVDSETFSFSWWRERFSGFLPSHIYGKYRLYNKRTRIVLFVPYFMKDFFAKGIFFVSSFFRPKDLGIRRYLDGWEEIMANIDRKNQEIMTRRK